MRVVFFGTSNVALPILEALHKHHEVVLAVSTSAESPVSILANELKLPLQKPADPADPDFISGLQALAADIFIVVSYGKILPENLINLPEHKTLNVHFSKLPELRGPAPIQFTLLQGKPEAWTSIFILDKEIDHGPVLAQKSQIIEPGDNFITLAQSLARLSAELLLDILPEYTAKRLTATEQDHSLATYTRHITKQDGKADWNKTPTEIYNQFRAFYPWPGLWTTWQGKTLKILDCLPGNNSASEPPGTVLQGGLIVCGQNTTLEIKSLQLEGKKEVLFSDFINGYRDFVGSSLV